MVGQTKAKQIVQEIKAPNSSAKHPARRSDKLALAQQNLAKEQKKLDVFVQDMQQSNADLSKDFTDFNQGVSLISARIAQNKIDMIKAKTESDKFKLLQANVDTFFKAWFAIDKLFKYLNKAKDETIQERKYTAEHEKLCIETKTKIENLYNRQQQIAIRIAHIKKNLTVNANEDILQDILLCQQKLAEITTTLKEINLTLDAKGPVTAEQMQIIRERHENTIDKIKSELHGIDRLISFADKQIRDRKESLEEIARAKADEREKKELEEKLLRQKEKQEFKEQHKLEIAAYKARVKDKREQKKNAKRAVVGSQNLFPEVKKAQFKNVTMEELLENLSKNNLDLLKAILTLKKGVTFDDVCNLVINHLGGRILEIGNGSSHKRIELAKYIIEVVMNDEEDSSENTEELKTEVAKGTVVQQHGKAHTSRTLSPFNLEMVQKTFIKAGITLEVIIQLENKKSATNAISSYKS